MVVVWCCYPTPSEGWRRGGTLRRPNSRATAQDLDQRSKMEVVLRLFADNTILIMNDKNLENLNKTANLKLEKYNVGFYPINFL